MWVNPAPCSRGGRCQEQPVLPPPGRDLHLWPNLLLTLWKHTHRPGPRPGPGLRDQSGEPVFQYVGQNRRPSHKVFVWGFSFSGALGVPSFVVPDTGRKKPRKYQLTPYRLDTAQKITSAACGYGFTLLASNTKHATKLWGMGLNKDSQLGFQRSQHSRAVSYDYVLEPSPVALPLSHLSTRLLQVSCGRAHSLVLTDQEGVFSFGNNALGQCGRPVVEDEVYSGSHIIHKIEGISGKVVQVSCGQDHSLFLTDEGKVFSCGWGADGQTGLGHHRTSWRPVEVCGDLSGVHVQQICSFADCSLALSRDGELFGWGNSEYHQLGLVTERSQIPTPRRLPLDGCGRLVQATCGGSQVAVLNDQGDVFVWGYGILGKGPGLSESRVPEQIPPSLFGRSDFNPSAAVARIHCGLNHFSAITDRGELFVWGKNVRGCLGIGTKDDQYFPWRVTVPGTVVDVACGVDHMVALVKSVV